MRALLILIGCLLLTACAVNPVTGERQLILASTDQEIAMGKQAYLPTQQSQGGVYDVDPELNAYVSGVGQRVAAQSPNPLPYEFIILNNSTPNAWALPGGKIAINRGLLTELNSEAELAAVLGHEVVHAAARHSAQQMTRGTLSQILVVGTAIAASDSDYGQLAVGGASIGAQALLARYGRGAELESDLYGMQFMREAGYDPSGAVTLQETFVRLSEGRNTDWLSGLFASHPPSQERVRANIETARSLPPGGDLGTDRYERAMKKTRNILPAYKVYDEGRKALAEKDLDTALAKAEQALTMFDGEAHFHALRGDVRFAQKNDNYAETNYSRAIERRDSFFYYYLQRGLARHRSGAVESAERDLETSNSLLPTAPAHYILGTIAENRGDYTKATEHYRAVASTQGDYGRAASARLARLDLPSNPGAYFSLACGKDSDETLLVRVRNDAQIAVVNVNIAVRINNGTAAGQQILRRIGGPLDPGGIATVDMDVGPYPGGPCPATIVGAVAADAT